MLCFLSKKKFLNLKKQLKETKEELLDISSYLNNLFSFLPIAVCDLNPLGVINNTNESFEKLTGYKQIEIVGERLEKIFLEKERVKEIQKHLLESGKTETIQLTLLTKEKQKIAVKVSFAIRKDTEGNIIGFFVSITDVSGLKRIQEEAEQKII
ncbi:PAS domain-containing protein, partial [bacterium]|nr:PAS domain-containing protein [bacterium]